MSTVREKIEALLKSHEISWRTMEHEYADTAEKAAQHRGTKLEHGGKSLVLKLGKGNDFAIFVVSGARRTDNKAIRKHLGVHRLRFATKEELMGLTGLKPGCIPPFGKPVFNLPLYVDTNTLMKSHIAFSLGSHTLSAEMDTTDYLIAARPTGVFPFSKAQSQS